jgi:hypothetical protein
MTTDVPTPDEPEDSADTTAGEVLGVTDATASDAPATTTRAPRARAAAVARPYPRRTLEDALRIPTAIKDKNGGQPWAPDQVAAAVGMGMSGTYFYLTSAARDFGLTEGTRDAAVISITDLGRHAVYPGSDDEGSDAGTGDSFWLGREGSRPG